jgi:hypothetical protein
LRRRARATRQHDETLRESSLGLLDQRPAALHDVLEIDVNLAPQFGAHGSDRRIAASALPTSSRAAPTCDRPEPANQVAPRDIDGLTHIGASAGGLPRFRAIEPQRPIQQDQIGREGMEIAIDCIERILCRVEQQTEHQRRRYHEDVRSEPDDVVRVVVP